MQKKQIFTEGEPEINDTLRINKAFAERFEKTKQRQILDLNRNQNLISDESSSQYSSEDSNGELITDQISEKFLTTLAKIHAHDPSLNEGKVFEDSDFEEENQESKSKSQSKSITYKDMVRESLLQNGKEPDEDEDDIGLVPAQEDENMKQEFRNAVKSVEQGDDFLKLKQKGKSQKSKEEKEYSQFLNTKSNEKGGKDSGFLQKFWNQEVQLDDNEKFLRKFILSKGWIDKDEEQEEQEEKKLLTDDESFEDKNDKAWQQLIDKFFIFVNKIQKLAYERTHAGPLHEKQASKRKTARERQKQIKDQKKDQAKKEIEIIKQAKQSEIKQRLQKLETVAGGIDIEEQNLENILKEDYDPDKFDKAMKEMFSETGYFKEEEKNMKELKGYIKKARGDEVVQTSEHTNQNEKLISEDKENADQVKTALPVGVKKKLKPEEIEQLNKEQFRIWYYCDSCNKGIQEYEMKFDCLECDDYCLCKKCKEQFPHGHKMRKNFVPKGCQPPPDEEIEQILSGVKYCEKCEAKINDYQNYYKKKDGEKVYCEVCYNKFQFEVRTELEMVEGKIDPNDINETNIDKLPKVVKDERINSLVDEYYALNFEDIIADGLKTKYKYIKVKPEDYGLTDDAIQFCDEQLLNSFVSVKKIAPYRQDEVQIFLEYILQSRVMYKKKLQKRSELILRKMPLKIKYQFDYTITFKKKKLKKNLKQLQKIKEELKQLRKQQKKAKKQKLYNEIIELEKKEKQLEYIISQGKEQVEAIDMQNAIKEEQNNEQPVQQKVSSNISSSRLKSYGIEQ